MRKWIGIGLVFAICIGVVGCVKKETPEQTLPNSSHTVTQTYPEETINIVDSTTEHTEREEISEEAYGEHLVQDQFYEDKKMVEGTEYTFSYHVPIILDDTQDAKLLNAQMEQLWKDTENPDSRSYLKCNWESYWNGSNVSFVLTQRGFVEENNQITTYTYDFSQGCTLSNKMLLERSGMDEEQALLAMKQSVAEIFDEHAIYIREQYPDSQGSLLDLRAGSLSDINLDPTNTPLYLDTAGILHAIVTMGTPAGGGYFLEDVTVLPKCEGAQEQTAILGNVSAHLKDNQAQVTFREEIRTGEYYLSGPAIEFQKPYPIHGLYGQYKDMALGCVGNDGTAYLCFLDTKGQVTVCDLMEAAVTGGEFYAAGPLSYPGKAVGFQTEKDESAHILWVNMEDGTQVAIDDMLRKEDVYGIRAIENSLWQQDLCQISVHAVEHDVMKFTWGNGGGLLGSGYLYYAGMDGKGLQYTGNLDIESGGTAFVQVTVCTDMITHEKTLTLRYLSGAPVPSLDKQQSMKLQYTGTLG